MNRETELHFSEVPFIDKPRSKFNRSNSHKTTFNAGDLVPVFLDMDILPGDTVKINTSMVVRMATPLYPVMDNAYLDLMYFFVPNRLVWDHWREFWGENEDPWAQTVEYEVPQITTSGLNVFTTKSVADYMGLPIGLENLSVSALPFRSYCKIYNDWFRDENLQEACFTTTGDANAVTSAAAYKGGTVLKANKFHDYFTSALPAPLKAGQSVTIPLGTRAPVITGDTHSWASPGLQLGSPNALTNEYTDLYIKKTAVGLGNLVGDNYARSEGININEATIIPTNLWTDLNNATSATISSLRTAFAVQRFFEAQARGGSRYIEFLKNIFGVTSPDARLQRSEYLGGKRIPINMMGVAQTGGTNDLSPQGNMAAYSQTADSDDYFTKSFTEHGILIGLAVVRTDHSYEQGIERGWSRKKWYDFYVPQFAHLSEQPIRLKEIYATEDTTDNETVFGYQEAWADYRYRKNMITGAMRSGYAQSLNAWHYGDYYTEEPVLGEIWIEETPTNIDRTIAVPSQTENQFIADFYFDCEYVRPMPIYSVPGLIDHF